MRRDAASAARRSRSRRSQTRRPLRYRDWVDGNRALGPRADRRPRAATCTCRTWGRRGYAEFHRGFLAEYDRDGLIVDVRYNGGGHVSALLLEKLARRASATTSRAGRRRSPIPTSRPRGPMVALTNEFAGSDGDIFSHTFKC